jgi:hypothetical protein
MSDAGTATLPILVGCPLLALETAAGKLREDIRSIVLANNMWPITAD